LDRIKLMAFMAMILDHINTLFLQPPRPELYAIGRMAFPLFLMIWAVNVSHRPERQQHRANRLWMWAILTQPAFVLAFGYSYGRPGLIAGTILLAVLVYPLSLASYGAQGVILALALAAFHSPRLYVLRQVFALAAFCALCSLNGSGQLTDKPVAVTARNRNPSDSQSAQISAHINCK
jgi:hypothetical protein